MVAPPQNVGAAFDILPYQLQRSIREHAHNDILELPP